MSNSTKVDEAALEFEASYESLRLELEARAADLDRYVSKPDHTLLLQLRKDRESLVTRINDSAGLANLASKREHVIAEAPLYKVEIPERLWNTQVLADFVNSFEKKRSPNVKATFHARSSENLKRVIIDRIGLHSDFKKDDVVIHVIERSNLSKPHGQLVTIKGDGTLIRKMGVYGAYGRAQQVKLKVDMKYLKGVLKNGAVATAATAQLVQNLNVPMTSSSVVKFGLLRGDAAEKIEPWFVGPTMIQDY